MAQQTYEWHLESGDHIEQEFQYTDDAGTAVNITGMTVVTTIDCGGVLLTPTSVVSNGAEGRVLVTLTAVQSAQLELPGTYRVRLVNGDAEPDTILRGNVVIHR